MRQVFHATATKGWAWCNHNAEVVERAAALRNLLLAGSGWLKFTKGVAGMDSLNKHVEQISFRQCVAFWEHRQLKGWQPHLRPTVAKSSLETTVHWFAAVTWHNWEHNHCIETNLGGHNSVTKPLLLCMRLVFHATATKGWAWCNHNAERLERAAALRNLKLLVGIGCWEFTKGMAGREQVSFPQWVRVCKHWQLKGWRHMAQLRAQSLHCNKSWRPQLRDKTPCFSAWGFFYPFLQLQQRKGMMQP